MQATEALCHLSITDIKKPFCNVWLFCKNEACVNCVLVNYVNLVTGRLAGISEGASRIKKKKVRPLFTIIFKPKMVILRLKILVTYSSVLDGVVSKDVIWWNNLS